MYDYALVSIVVGFFFFNTDSISIAKVGVYNVAYVQALKTPRHLL